MRKLLLTLKILGAIVALLIVLLVGATFLLNSSSFQNKVMKRATEMLSERLGTRVTVDSVHVSLMNQVVELYGVDVEDQQQRKMLQVEQLAAGIRLMALRHDEVDITKVSLKGCRALVVKADTDSVANFQFVIDSLSRKTKEQQPDSAETKSKKKLKIDVNNVAVDDINLQYNGNRYHLGWLGYHHQSGDTYTVEVRDVTTAWKSKNKKGITIDHTASVGALLYVDKNGRRQLKVENLRYKTDNHRPRKNHNRPKRGAFDVGHFDACLQLQAMVSYLSLDSVAATVRGSATDAAMGIDLKQLNMKVAANKREAHLSNVTIQQGQTTLKFADGIMTFANKKEGRSLAYRTSPISGHVVLKDISKTFAPVLSQFTLPLQLVVTLNGTDQGMTFTGVRVNTPEKKLRIRADGNIKNLKDSRQLVVHFNVSEMFAKGGIKEKVISQFPVKRLMMKQLHALGDIHYTGQFDVVWRKEIFRGRLTTNVGNIGFNFTIDENQKYVFGNASSPAINVDKTFNLPDIGVAACKANFKIDISKPRTAKMRQLKGGHLPIGHVGIQVEEVIYKKLKVRNVDLDVESDGAVATGSMHTRGRHMDLMCNFSFTNTDDMKKMKITKPGIKLHRLSDEDRQKKAEEKERKKLEKQLKKQQKKEEKKAKQEQEEKEEKKKRGFLKKIFGISH